MVTRSPRIFTGLENLRIDPKLGLVMKQRTRKTPYRAIDPLDRESDIYVSQMPESYKELRFKLLHPDIFDLEAEGLLRLPPQELALAMPEWAGGAVPRPDIYPETYEPAWFKGWMAGGGPARAQQATQAQQQISANEMIVRQRQQAAARGFVPFSGAQRAGVDPRTGKPWMPAVGAQRVAVDPATGQPIPPTEFLNEAERSYWMGERTGLPQGGISAEQEEWIEAIRATGAAPEGWAESDWQRYQEQIGTAPQRVLDITTITADMLADVPGLKEGMKVARLSTGEMIPVQDETADAWTGELPSADILSALPPGAVFLGIDDEGNVSYLPAAGRLNVYGLQRPQPIGIQAEGLGAFTQEDIERFEGFELLTLESDKLSDDEIDDARRWVMASPANALEYTMLMRSIGRNDQTEALVRRMVGKPVSYDEMSEIFGEAPAVAPKRGVIAPEVPDLLSAVRRMGVSPDMPGLLMLARAFWMDVVRSTEAVKQGLITMAEGAFPSVPPLELADMATPERLAKMLPSEFAGLQESIEAANRRRFGTDRYNKGIRDTLRQLGARQEAKHEEWLKDNPQFQPPAEYARINTVPDMLYQIATDPKYLPYLMVSNMANTIAIYGAMYGVSRTGNLPAAMAAGAALMTPREVNEIEMRLREAGVGEDQATQLAVPVGALIASIEGVGNIPLLRLLPGPFRKLGDMYRVGATRALVKATMAQLLKKGLRTFTIIEFTETMEEVAQGALSNYTVSFFDENVHVFDNIGVTILQTLAATLPFAGLGANIEIRSQLKRNRQIGIQVGLTEAQARLVALNRLAATPEGEAALTGLTNQMVDESAKGTLNTFLQRLISEERGAIELPGEAPKEAWQMTQAEYIKTGTQRAQKEVGQYTLKSNHEQYVRSALEEGEPVPAEVLADYPELAKAIPPAEKVEAPAVEAEIPQFSKTLTDLGKPELYTPETKVMAPRFNQLITNTYNAEVKGNVKNVHIGKVNGKPAWADGFMLEIKPVPEKWKTQKGYRPVTTTAEGKPRDFTPLVPEYGAEASEATPILRLPADPTKRAGATFNLDRTFLVDATGEKYTALDTKYFNYFKANYPDAKFIVKDRSSPIVVQVKGKTVGVVMPIAQEESTFNAVLEVAGKRTIEPPEVMVKGADGVYRAPSQIAKPVEAVEAAPPAAPAAEVEAPAVEVPLVKEGAVEVPRAEPLAPGEAEVTLARPPEAVPEEAVPPTVPPIEPPEAAIPEPVPPVEPVILEIDRIIEQSQKQVEQDAPRWLVRMFHAIPGLKQLMEFERPALKMTGENQKVVAALVAEQAARADVATRSMSTRLPLLRRLADTFGKDVLRGKAKSAIEFLGTEEQKQSTLTGTLKDIVDNPELYDLSYEQANLIGDIQERNDATLDWVVSGYNAEIGRYMPKGAGAWLPNVDISEDVVEYLGSETKAVVSGRGKTRVWATARDRLEHDASFVPELDVQKLLEGADSFKASAAGGQTYRQTIGGLTRLEAIEKTHPKLYARMIGLRKQLQKLLGYRNVLRDAELNAVEDFLASNHEDEDITNLHDSLELKPGRYVAKVQAGKTFADIDAELNQVRTELAALRLAWKAANLKPYVFVKDLYRYFPGDQANLIVESRQVSNSPLLKFVERWRAGAFSGDLSPFAIQGSLGVLADPYGAIKVGVGSARSAIEAEDFLRSYKVEALAEDIAANPDEWAQYASLSGRQLTGTPQEYAAGFLSLIPGASRFTEATYLTVTRQSFDLWRRTADSLAKHGVPELDAKIVAMEVADKVYPLINPKRLGQSEARTSFIRALPTSYSFIRQPMSMIAEASTGYAKLIAFQKLSPKELMAVKVVTTMAASVMAASVASAAISAIARGDDDDKVWQAIKDAINPDPYNGKFAAIIIGDTRIPIGGPYRAIFRALYPQDVKGVPFPVPFAGLVRYFANRVTPALSTQVDLVRNRDYWGRTILKGNVPEQIVRGLEYELENMLPLTAGGFVESLRTKREKDEMVREVIGQFMGVNPVKLDNTYLFKQERKLGTEKLEPPPEFSSKRPIYDVGDYWGDTNRLIRDIPTEHIGRRNFPQSVKAIAEARDMLDESVNVLPNKSLVSINADPEKGDTFVQFFNQWTQRKTLKEGELDEFDRKYPQAELGNITLRQFDLLREYHRLPDKDKQAQFLKDHPELTQNPRQEWLRSHPEDNAKLAIWGQAKALTKEAYDKTLALAKSYDIPDSALPQGLPPKEVANAFFQYEDLLKDPDISAGSLEARLHRLDNPEFDKWKQKVDKVQPVEIKSVDAARLTVKNRALQKERDALRGKDLMETEKLRADFDAKHVEFTKDRLRVEGYEKAVPGNLIEDYVASKQVERKGFEDEWFWLEHPDLYRFMTSGAKPLMTQKDFSKVPTREVGRLWDEYENDIDKGDTKARLAFRIKHPELDAWLVKAKGYTPAEGRGKAKAPTVPSFRMRTAAPRAAAVRRPAVGPRPAPQPVAAPPPAQRQPRIVLPSRSRGRSPTAALRRRGVLR